MFAILGIAEKILPFQSSSRKLLKGEFSKDNCDLKAQFKKLEKNHGNHEGKS